jgi:hypothetical protein
VEAALVVLVVLGVAAEDELEEEEEGALSELLEGLLEAEGL